MGVFEYEAFSRGTFAIAETLAEITPEGCTTIVGGGDSVAAVEQVKKNVSTVCVVKIEPCVCVFVFSFLPSYDV